MPLQGIIQGQHVPQQEHIFSGTQTPQALSLFPWAEHQLSKPDVVSQLEEEEALWSVERGIPQDTFSGENQAHRSPGRDGLFKIGTGVLEEKMGQGKTPDGV